MDRRHAAIVLAGGRSVRMGRPKATLPWGEVTLIEHVLDVLGTHCEPRVVVGHRELVLPPLPDGVHRLDDPPHRDDQGPLVGVLRGLEHLRGRAELVFVAACDAPWLSPEHVAFMLDRLEREPELEAAMPCSTDTPPRPFPLGGVLRVEPALRMTSTLLDQGERALGRLFSALRCDAVPTDALPDPDALRDCNTDEHYRAALAERLR